MTAQELIAHIEALERVVTALVRKRDLQQRLAMTPNTGTAMAMWAMLMITTRGGREVISRYCSGISVSHDLSARLEWDLYITLA